jgi:hypothetical protein
VWGGAEFLLWWIKDGHVPPLVTAGPPASLGVLGSPGTSSLLGGSLGYDHRPGARFTFGASLDEGGAKGVELSYFFLCGGDGLAASTPGADGSVALARPFLNIITGLPDAQLFSFPGLARGSVRVSADSEKKLLQGAELNLLCNVCCQSTCSRTDCSSDGSYRLDVLAGPRWLQFDEGLAISELVRVADPATTFAVSDRFETRNSFYGGQVGVRAEWQQGYFFVNLLGKVALGDTRQEVRVSGTTAITQPGAPPSIQPGGLLALPTNIGTYRRDTFSVVPEIGVRVGCQLAPCLRAYAGYSCLYWSRVARPGDQIDIGVNPTQLPSADGPGSLLGPPRPAFAFHDACFWAQGVSVGMEFQW